MAAHFGTAVVSGALSMTGSAYAEYLARKGFDLMLIDRHRTRLNRLADALTTSTRRAVEVVVANRRSPVDLAAVAAQIGRDASIVLVVNVADAQGCTLLSASQADALISAAGPERVTACAAMRQFLSKRGMVLTHHAYVHVAAASHITELPLI
jgi:short-subunit dehydrogenase